MCIGRICAIATLTIGLSIVCLALITSMCRTVVEIFTALFSKTKWVTPLHIEFDEAIDEKGEIK